MNEQWLTIIFFDCFWNRSYSQVARNKTKRRQFPIREQGWRKQFGEEGKGRGKKKDDPLACPTPGSCSKREKKRVMASWTRRCPNAEWTQGQGISFACASFPQVSANFKTKQKQQTSRQPKQTNRQTDKIAIQSTVQEREVKGLLSKCGGVSRLLYFDSIVILPGERANRMQSSTRLGQWAKMWWGKGEKGLWLELDLNSFFWLSCLNK